MEHANPSVNVQFNGRALSLRFNARAWRLIKEHTAFDILQSSGDRDGVNRILGSSDNLPRVFWALTQNTENGAEEGEWPAFSWVEEHLDLSNVEMAIQAIGDALPKGEARGNGQPEASRRKRSRGSTSGHLDITASASPQPNSGSLILTKSELS